jgi:outer membrane protein assembly factor BamD
MRFRNFELNQRPIFRATVVAAVALSLTASCARRKAYENPIGKDTLQPDKVLFDKAIADIERSRYEVARITLNTLMNTYDTSEFLAKAKLAIADSWYREGGSNGLAQAEAEYKDFILFYPNMEESAEAQEKICMIHYNQMEKPDRDPKHALRAEDECRQLLVLFPNSKFAPRAQQLLRNIQEVLADREFKVGDLYHHKGSYPAAANRLQFLTDQYPLYSSADQANFMLGDSYEKMGERFFDRSAAAYQRIVKEYPLSPYVEQAKARLDKLERPIPEPDPTALARMKYEQENMTKRGVMGRTFGMLSHSPDTSRAAKSGTPAMASMQPSTPVSVPSAAGAATTPPAGGVTADVTVETVRDSTALDNNPDARARPATPEQKKQ